MCLQPLRLRSNSTYKVNSLTPVFNEVPCNKCLECQQAVRSEWLNRISYEIHSLYKRGGCAVFLTFTYDENHLPYYSDTYSDLNSDKEINIKCFNHDDVLTFLNRLKVSVWRLYGKSSYRYFFTSEYGKDTKRPHYHGLFFLESHVNMQVFTELCRDCWEYGFMFPKFDKRRHVYVDNYGKAQTPEIRSLHQGAKYVSKYCTKDLTYYELPDLNDYFACVPDAKLKMKRYLPKHWQSNFLGYSALDYIDFYDFKKSLDNGIYNPILGKNVEIPRYILNRLIYKNVSTKDTVFERMGKNGKPLYDRVLTLRGREILSYYFDKKVISQNRRFSEIFQKYSLSPVTNKPLSPIFHKLGIDVTKDFTFTHLSLYYILLRRCGDAAFDWLTSNRPFQSWKDIDYNEVKNLWIDLHDVDKLRNLSLVSSKYKPDGLMRVRLYYSDFDTVAFAWQFYSCLERFSDLSYKIERERLLKHLKYMYSYSYDKNLC